MNSQVDIIFITNLPSFYKINLYNRIAKHKKIFVVFTHNKSVDRNDDFYKGNREFDYISLGNKSIILKILFIVNMLITTTYQQVIIGGWDQLLFWITAFISNVNKNGVVIESSIIESGTTGFKGFVKKLFLSRFTKAYVSGKSQANLCSALNFGGKLIFTNGVGVFNVRPQQKYRPAREVKNFIYVGRLSPEKNLLQLINKFNDLPELNLNIVGFGPQEMLLKSIAKQNIIFHGAIRNTELYKFYQQNEVFILPSISEPWGMVVEEALNCGLPVIVSDSVGCAEEIVNKSNGIVFKLTDPAGLKNAIIKILNINYYNSLRLNVSKMDFEKIAQEQVNCYLCMFS